MYWQLQGPQAWYWRNSVKLSNLYKHPMKGNCWKCADVLCLKVYTNNRLLISLMQLIHCLLDLPLNSSMLSNPIWQNCNGPSMPNHFFPGLHHAVKHRFLVFDNCVSFYCCCRSMINSLPTHVTMQLCIHSLACLYFVSVSLVLSVTQK